MRPAYRVWRLRPRSLLPLLPVAALAGLATVERTHAVRTAVFCVVVLLLTAARVRFESVRLRVGDAGILLGAGAGARTPVFVPWSSMRQVVVSGTRVGVLLQAGAPRPRGLRGIVHDPREPDRLDPQLVRDLPGLDAAALQVAVTARGGQVRVDPAVPR